MININTASKRKTIAVNILIAATFFAKTAEIACDVVPKYAARKIAISGTTNITL
jgi:hypothetical protein